MNAMENIQKEPTVIWNRGFISVFFVNMMMFFGQQITNVLVPKYTYAIGGSPMMVGFIASSFAYTALLLKVFAAPAIDTFNKKVILGIAIFTMAFAYLGYSSSRSIPSVLAFRLIQGAGQAFSATCCLALATDMLPRNKIGTGIGYYSVAQAICQSIGPSVGLAMVGHVGYRITFVFCACVMVVAAIMALRLHTNFVRTKKFSIRLNGIVAKEAIVPAFLMFFLCMAYYNVTAFLVIYAEIQGIKGNVGFFFTVYAITLLFSRPLVGRMSDRYGTVKVLIPAMLCFACAFILIGVAHSLTTLLIAAFVSAFGYGACQPAVQTLCMKSVPREKRGAGSTTNYIGQDAGNLVGPIVAGLVIEHFGYHMMWFVMIIPVIIAMGIVLVDRASISAHTAQKQSV